MIETADKGPVVLHSFVDPRAGDKGGSGKEAAKIDAGGFLDIGRLPDIHAMSAEPTIPIIRHSNEHVDKVKGDDAVTNGLSALHLVPSGGTGATEEEKDLSAPMLIGTVVVGSHSHIREARHAASKLEALGRSVQEDWKRESKNPCEVEPAEGG